MKYIRNIISILLLSTSLYTMAESHMYHGKETSYLTSFIHGMGNMCMAETPHITEILYIPMMGSIFIKGHRRTILRLFSHGMDSTCTKGILQTILILSSLLMERMCIKAILPIILTVYILFHKDIYTKGIPLTTAIFYTHLTDISHFRS